MGFKFRFTLHRHIARQYVFLMGHVVRLSGRTYQAYLGYNFKKMTLFLFSIFLAYFVFANPHVRHFIAGLNTTGYLGFMVAGLFFPFGFTASFAVGFFIIAGKFYSPFLGAILAGVGSLVSDLAIFKFIQVSFKEEFIHLFKLRPFRNMRMFFERTIPRHIEAYLTVALAGILIGSPLPDELGIMVLAGFTEIKETSLMILSYVLNTVGIYIILVIAHGSVVI